MTTPRRLVDHDELTDLGDERTRVLSSSEEREILLELVECKRALAEALARMPKDDCPGGADDPSAFAQYVIEASRLSGPRGAQLGKVARRYQDLRTRLALANTRLVAHVAKRFRDRGIAYADLIQEGMCGLLEAIDRFDMGHETKLATYATWWIRQAMQKSVAAGAYPVRLSPRHLRQLAQSQDERDGAAGSPAPSAELIQRIHAATRPALSLDARVDPDRGFSLMETMSAPEAEPVEDAETGEAVGRLMDVLRPREQEVLNLRFGLSGRPGLSLSEVGRVLAVSKERVRQIQDRALAKLRAAAEVNSLAEAFTGA